MTKVSKVYFGLSRASYAVVGLLEVAGVSGKSGSSSMSEKVPGNGVGGSGSTVARGGFVDMSSCRSVDSTTSVGVVASGFTVTTSRISPP